MLILDEKIFKIFFSCYAIVMNMGITNIHLGLPVEK